MRRDVSLSLSYERLWSQIEYVGSCLASQGLGSDDRVAVVLPKGPEMAVLFLSVAGHSVCAPLNPAYRASEFAFYFDDLRIRALILPKGHHSPAREAAGERGIRNFRACFLG